MATTEPIVMVYTTAPDMATARDIGQALVLGKIAACVNILPGMVSMYRWQGAINTDDEVVLIIKTRRSLSQRVVQDVIARHPYDVPSVMVLDVSSGNPELLSWIEQEALSPNSEQR